MAEDSQEGKSAIAIAKRGLEITGSAILQQTEESISSERVEELMAQMNNDEPTGGSELTYGGKDVHKLRFWKAGSDHAPLIIFVHGGSWRAGTYLDSIGATKVGYLTNLGFAFATVNYTIIPEVTVEKQVQEVADSLAYLIKHADDLNFFDPTQVFLMGHSSGAHVVTLLGTDTSYFQRAGVDISVIRGVVSLDGSNYNAVTECIDSPGPVADSTEYGLGSEIARLRAMSPTYHAFGPNARTFLLLHARRHGDIRQAIEFEMALRAAGTNVALHVFEGEGFEGHMQMLLRLGDPDYPATNILGKWLQQHTRVEPA